MSTLPQRLFLVNGGPAASSPSDPGLPINQEHVSDVLVRHAHGFPQVLK